MSVWHLNDMSLCYLNIPCQYSSTVQVLCQYNSPIISSYVSMIPPSLVSNRLTGCLGFKPGKNNIYIYIYIYIYVWKLNQTVLELDFRAVKFLFFPRRIWTHTIDTLQHHSLSLTSSALDHSTTSTPLKRRGNFVKLLYLPFTNPHDWGIRLCRVKLPL
jgi:hypothetical protein